VPIHKVRRKWSVVNTVPVLQEPYGLVMDRLCSEEVFVKAGESCWSQEQQKPLAYYVKCPFSVRDFTVSPLNRAPAFLANIRIGMKYLTVINTIILDIGN